MTKGLFGNIGWYGSQQKSGSQFASSNNNVNQQKPEAKNQAEDANTNSNQSNQNQANSQNSNQQSEPAKGSFAERFSANRRPKFTSESLESKSQSQNPDLPNIPDPAKKVDPKKKMMSNLIYLVKGIDDGRNAWYYVLVDRLKVKMFLKALNDDIIHLENYGQILYSAYGDEPPKEITDALKEEYGIES